MVVTIVSFEGIQGCGKTTVAVALCDEEYRENGRKIVSNDHLNLPYTHFDIAWFLEHLIDSELEDCILLLDEMYQIADSRSSATKLNKLFTYFIVQARKRDVDLYICTHHLDHIDLRLRRAVDIRGACRFYPEKPCKKCRGRGETGGTPCDRCLGYGELGWVRVYFLDRRLRRRYSLEVFANRYWHLFNTRERIPMQARIFQGIDTLEV